MNKGQIVKIKGAEGEWYQEAIFVMKDELVASLAYKDLQERADRIIGNYAKQNGLRSEAKRRSNTRDRALNLILASSIGILMVCIYLL